MYYGLFSRKTARLLRSYASEDEAFAAARTALSAEPELAAFLAVVEFDEDGRCVREWSGSKLLELVHV